MRIDHNVPLALRTTLRVGGVAKRLAELSSEEDVVEAVRQADRNAEPFFVLGGGSNVVVADEGFDGLVGMMAVRGVEARREGNRVVVDVGAGEDWDGLVARAVDEGWQGVASLSGIPGLAGATPIQNVGAYGEEVAQTIASVRVFDRASSTLVDMSRDECHFGYRASLFKGDSRWIVTRVRFAFERGSDAVVRYAELARALSVSEGAHAPARTVRETVIRLRKRKGMVVDAADPDSVSAGSFFVNPVVDEAIAERVDVLAGAPAPRFVAGPGKVKLAAAWLVERAGFPKGWGDGRAGISRKHALAIVNRGGATARDVLAAARAIRQGVRAKFGIILTPEPVLVGVSWEEEDL